tara:strand:- start:866 stop:3100 length:2235 start_codon:yes stop_codon:yes gene_type:complete
MSSFPNFSNIRKHVKDELINRKDNTLKISKLNCWTKITSGVGMAMVSNPDYPLFKAAGSNSGIYGDETSSGTIGTSWGGTPISETSGQGFRPSPVVTSMEIDEGSGTLSRKASFSITAFTREQMELITEYYLEPGYSIFLEWGWNTPGGVGGIVPSNAAQIAQFQSSHISNEKRKSSGGHYDNYLGFITGGGVSIDGDKWTIDIKCTGFTELPAYLLTSETGNQKEGEEAKVNTASLFGTGWIAQSGATLGEKRWMAVFNALPKNRQTIPVKRLYDTGKHTAEITNVFSYINFDEEVSEKINENTAHDGWFDFGKGDVEVNGETVDLEKGTKIVADDRFIKFSTLMIIFNQIGIEGYKLGGDDAIVVKFAVNTTKTTCSAFRKIFSIDGGRLFIPNAMAPKLSLNKITGDSTVASLTSETVPQSMGPNQFPQPDGITIPASETGDSNGVTLIGGEWGYLNDLYVNFDFAKGIMETPNFFIKDALYQLLNGISSAVNGMWDFQIQEVRTTDGNSTELRVFEMNSISRGTPSKPYEFNLIGSDSVFIDASLDLDISGAKMNQVIGQRLSKNDLGVKLNGDASRIPGALFATKLDLLKIEIKKKEVEKDDKVTKSEDDADAAKEQMLNIILGKAKFYPKPEFEESSAMKGDLYNYCVLGAFNDSSLFSLLKHNMDEAAVANSTPSPLMPINFSFTIHGVSGIRRGDMFKVNGIPKMYQKGFFQVLSVKQVIDGMMWKTEVTGGYRNS